MSNKNEEERMSEDVNQQQDVDNNASEPKDLVNLQKRMEYALFAIDKKVDDLSEYSLKTRKYSVMSSCTPEYLAYTFERSLADTFAINQSLLSVEKELTDRSTAYEAAVREKSRYAEKIVYFNRYLDDILQNMRSISEQNDVLQLENRKLKLELEAATQAIENFESIVTMLRTKANKSQLPQDLIANIKNLMPEIMDSTKKIKEDESVYLEEVRD